MRGNMRGRGGPNMRGRGGRGGRGGRMGHHGSESNTEPVKVQYDFLILDRNELISRKLALIDLSLQALLDNPKPSTDNVLFNEIVKESRLIAFYEPEYILKLSLYLRVDLNIRSISNFLVAMAASISDCQKYLKKYVSHIIKLPSDWLEVIDFFQSLDPEKKSYIPSSLRKALLVKFSDFDQYQLGKYNRERSIKKKRKEGIKTGVTLKEMVRQLHIFEPAESVLGIIGKKYPSTAQEFYKSRLPGKFDPTQAGLRMKLPVPETWETLVSAKGNVASTWEELLDHKKLPFMAMLRNLRNILYSGVDARYHKMILKILQNPKSIANSKQFPIRFYKAYKEIPQSSSEMKAFIDSSLMKGKFRVPKVLPTDSQLDEYRDALNQSIKLATLHNILPIKGSTLIFCSAPGTDINENLYLLALMTNYASESSKFYIIGASSNQPQCVDVQFDSDSILENLQSIRKYDYLENNSQGLLDYIINLISSNKWTDNIIYFHDGDTKSSEITNALKKYRTLVNPDLLYVSVNVSGRGGVDRTIGNSEPNDIYISGFSDQILRFIVEKGENSQLRYVDNIDDIKGIKMNEQQEISVSPWWKWLKSIGKLPQIMPDLTSTHEKWRKVKVFISSTFVDMHGERNLMTSIIFPELKDILKSRKIQIQEIDLRWGVTEEETVKGRSLDVCLKEVLECDYFIGILGSRYGFKPSDYTVSPNDKLEWLKDYPAGRSITELEIMCALKYKKDKSFFYIRDKKVLKEIPQDIIHKFEDTNPNSKKLLLNLKRHIVSASENVFVKYPSTFMKQATVPEVENIQEFGNRIFEDIYGAIDRDFPLVEKGTYRDPLLEVNESYIEECNRNFVGREEQLSILRTFARSHHHNILVLHGSQGEGKSALLAKFVNTYYNSHKTELVIPHFCGIYGSQTNVSMLTRFCRILETVTGRHEEMPEKYEELLETFFTLTRFAAFERQVVFVVDGIENLDTGYQWINATLGAKFIVSTSSKVLLESFRSKNDFHYVEVAMSPLSMKEGSLIVRHILGQYRKKLSETATNNQMRALLKKKDAVKPLYLVLACEELRVFGVFEEVTSFINNLGATLPSLLSATLERIENIHGKGIISNLLTLSIQTRKGLMYADAKNMLGIDSHKWIRVLRSLSPYLVSNKGEWIAFNYQEMITAIKTRYSIRVKGKTESHALMASYYSKCYKQSSKDIHTHVLSELPYHLIKANMNAVVEVLLTDLLFIRRKFESRLGYELLEDYVLALENITSDRLGDFYHFVNNEYDTLSQYPHMIIQQAINQPSSSYPFKMALVGNKPADIIKWKNKPNARSKCLSTISGLGEGITAMAYLPSKKMIAVACKDLTIRLVHSETRVNISTFRCHSNHISCLAFSNDGNYLASGSWDFTVKLINLDKLEICSIMVGHKKQVNHVAFSHDGDLIASSSWDCTVKIWDTTGELKSTIYHHTRPVNCSAFIKNSNLIMSGSWDGVVHITDIYSATLIKSYNTSDLGSISSLSSSSKHIMTGHRDGSVALHDINNGRFISTLNTHESSVNKVAFSKKGRLAISCSDDATIKIAHSHLGVELLSYKESEKVTAIDFHPKNSAQFITGTSTGHLSQWDTASKEKLWSIQVSELSINEAVYSKSGTYIALCSELGIYVYTEAGTLFKEKKTDYGTKVNSVRFSNNEKYIGYCTANGLVEIWDFTSDIVICTLRGHADEVSALSFDKTDSQICSVSRDRVVKVWSLKNQACIMTKLLHSDWITSIEFHHSKRMIITSSYDNTIGQWDIAKNKVKYLKGHITACLKVKYFGENCQYILSAASDGTVILWNEATGSEITTVQGSYERINGIAIANDLRVLCADEAGAIKMWDILSPKIETPLCGHSSKVTTFEVSKNRIISASDDKSLKVWNLYEPENNESSNAVLEAHSSRINSISIHSYDRVLTSAHDRTCKLWNIETMQNIKSLSHEYNIQSSVFLDRNSFILGSTQGEIIKWDVRTAQSVLSFGADKAHNNCVSCLDVHDHQILSGGWDSKLNLWDTRNPRSPVELFTFSDWVTSCSFSPTHKNEIIASSWNGEVLRFQKSSRKSILKVDSNITGCKYSECGGFASISDSSGKVHLYEVSTSKIFSEQSSQLALTGIDAGTFRSRGDFITVGEEKYAKFYNMQCKLQGLFPLRAPGTCVTLNKKGHEKCVLVGDRTGAMYILN